MGPTGLVLLILLVCSLDSPVYGSLTFTKEPTNIPILLQARTVTRLKLQLIVSETATVSCRPYLAGSATPTIAEEVISPNLHRSGTRNCLSGRRCNVLLTGLSPDTSYEVYCVAINALETTNITGPVAASTTTTVSTYFSVAPYIYVPPTANTCTLKLATSMPSPVYCAALLQGSTPIENLDGIWKAHTKGWGHCGAGDCLLTINDLIPETTYDLYCAAGNGIRQTGSVSSILSVTMGPVGDLTFTSNPQVVGGVGVNSFTLNLALDFTSDVTCALFKSASTAPAFHKELAAGSHTLDQECEGGQTCTFFHEGLPAETHFYVYCGGKTRSGVTSNISPMIEVTTKPPARVEFLTGPLVSRSTPTTLELELTVDTQAQLKCGLVATGSPAPTSWSQLDAALHMATQTCGDRQSCGIRVTGLALETSFDIYCMALSTLNSMESFVSPKVEGTTLPAAQGEFLSGPVLYGVPEPRGMGVEVTINAEGTTTCAAFESPSTPPAETTTVLDAIQKEEAYCWASTPCQIYLAQVFTSSAYTLYCVHLPDQGTISNVSSGADADLPEADLAPKYVYGPLVYSATSSVITIHARISVWADLHCAAFPSPTKPTTEAIDQSASKGHHVCLPGRLCWVPVSVAGEASGTTLHIFCYPLTRRGLTTGVSSSILVVVP